MTPAHIDFETRSTTELKSAGLYRYAEDPNTGVWGFRYRFGVGGTTHTWMPGYPDPLDLLHHVANGGEIVAHNAAFERTIWNVVILREHPNWPRMTIAQQNCTMARAAIIAHPQALDTLSKALNLDTHKDVVGQAVMKKIAKPRRVNADGSVTWWDDPVDVNRVMSYCGDDVQVEVEADGALPPMSARMRHLWELDQLINERGVRVDISRVARAAELVEYAKKQNDATMRDITGRTVPKCSSDAKIIEFLNARGIECTSLAKGEIEDVVFSARCALDTIAEDVIALRKASWKTSTAKYKAMQKCVCHDGRIRGLLNFHGASTGRWAGRLVQTQNFPRLDNEDAALMVRLEYLRELLADYSKPISYVHDMITAVYGPLEALNLLSKALRAMIIATEGNKLLGGDFSNIEGRVNAWLAGEDWKTQAFADYDTFVVDDNGKRGRKGIDLYVLAYARSFGVDPSTVGKGQKRQIGKVQELALGYQGSIGAYIAMGATYGVNPFTLARPVYETTDPEQWAATAKQYDNRGVNKYDLPRPEWTALKVLVDNWRAANPKIVQSWWNYQDAVTEAVSAPGYLVHPKHTQKVGFYSDGRCLWAVLPSGRMLCYASPEIETTKETAYRIDGTSYERTKHTVTYMGMDSVTHQWKRQSLYGGKICENLVQAIACDIMCDAMFNMEDAGYPLIMTVHDELLAEVPDDGMYSVSQFNDIMAKLNPEYAGLPVSVSAWEDYAYVK